MTCRQRHELSALVDEECVNAHQKRARPLLNERHESRVEFIFFCGTQDMNFPKARAAACACLVSVSAFGLSGLLSTEIAAACGTSSCSNSICLATRSALNRLTPVTLPPGRLKLATRPSLTGSPPVAKRIGMVAVAAFAASATAGLPLATIIATRRLLIRSAIIGANGSR